VSGESASLQPLSAGSFFERARARLKLEVPPALTDPLAQGARGDLDLNPAMWERAGVSATKPAAVLIPIIDRSEPMVLLTVRTQELASHAGQVAFPGGKIDPLDASPVAAALREAKEEIGLKSTLVEPLGYLDLYLTFSGFRILPTVARVKPSFTLTLNPWEVTETFEVPLAFLMTPANHQRKSREWKGMTREYYAMPFGDHYIWGMIRPLLGEIGLFLVPFALYAGFLLATRAGVLQPNAWTMRRLAGLVVASLVLMAASFLLLARFSGSPPGSTYVPAHVENGKFVPGATR